MSRTPCQKRQATLATRIHRDGTKPRGFRKKGALVFRTVDAEPLGLLQRVDVQGSAGNSAGTCSVYINVAASWLWPGQVPDRPRLFTADDGFRVEPPPTHADGPSRWRLHDDDDLERALDHTLEGLEWFDRSPSGLELFRSVEARCLERPIDAWPGRVQRLCRTWRHLAEPGHEQRIRKTARDWYAWLERERAHADRDRLLAELSDLVGLDLH